MFRFSSFTLIAMKRLLVSYAMPYFLKMSNVIFIN